MRTVASLALFLALTGCVSVGTYNKKKAEASKFRQYWEDEVAKRAVLQEKIKAMQQQLDSITADLNSLREKVQSEEGTLAQKEAQLREAQERLAQLQGDLSKSTAELEKKSSEYERFANALRSEIDAGRIELMELRGRTTVKMKDKILFSSGSATIGAEGRRALKKVADALGGLEGKAIRVEGHTDNVPTGSRRLFPSNWELSAARALAVVRFLQASGVDPTRLSGTGFGEFQPIQSNDTPEGRSLNRRIEISLVPLQSVIASPPAGAPASQPAPQPAASRPAKAKRAPKAGGGAAKKQGKASAKKTKT